MQSGFSKKEKLNGYLKAILFIYLFTVFSGAIRKWLISSKEIGNFVLFLQIIIPYSLLIVKGGMHNWKIGKSFFYTYIIVLVLCSFNPFNKTIYHGILGILLHASFFFIVIFYVNNRDNFNFNQLLKFFVPLGVFQLILVFIQYTQPPDSFINTYADVEAVGSVAIVGTSARVSGTFSYISGFTGFLFFHSLFVWALFKHKLKSYIILYLLFFGLIACFMSGARSATYLYLIIFSIFAVIEMRTLRNSVFNIKLLLPILITSLIILGTGNKSIGELIERSFGGFVERRDLGKESGEENERIYGDFNSLLNFSGKYPVFGLGLGSTYQGANKIFGTSQEILDYGFFESELIRILLEGGFFLFIIRVIFLIYVFNLLAIPLLAKVLLCIILLFFFSIVFNLYNSVFAAIGIIFLDYYYYNELISKRTLLINNHSKKHFNNQFNFK